MCRTHRTSIYVVAFALGVLWLGNNAQAADKHQVIVDEVFPATHTVGDVHQINLEAFGEQIEELNRLVTTHEISWNDVLEAHRTAPSRDGDGLSANDVQAWLVATKIYPEERTNTPDRLTALASLIAWSKNNMLSSNVEYSLLPHARWDTKDIVGNTSAETLLASLQSCQQSFSMASTFVECGTRCLAPMRECGFFPTS